MPAKKAKKKSSSALYKSRLANLKKARAVRARNLGKSSARSTTKAPVRRRRKTVKAPVRRSRRRTTHKTGGSEERLVKALVKYGVMQGDKSMLMPEYYPLKSSEELFKDYQEKEKKMYFDPKISNVEKEVFEKNKTPYLKEVKNLRYREELSKLGRLKAQGLNLNPVPQMTALEEEKFNILESRSKLYGGRKENTLRSWLSGTPLLSEEHPERGLAPIVPQRYGGGYLPKQEPVPEFQQGGLFGGGVKW